MGAIDLLIYPTTMVACWATPNGFRTEAKTVFRIRQPKATFSNNHLKFSTEEVLPFHAASEISSRSFIAYCDHLKGDDLFERVGLTLYFSMDCTNTKHQDFFNLHFPNFLVHAMEQMKSIPLIESQSNGFVAEKFSLTS